MLSNIKILNKAKILAILGCYCVLGLRLDLIPIENIREAEKGETVYNYRFRALENVMKALTDKDNRVKEVVDSISEEYCQFLLEEAQKLYEDTKADELLSYKTKGVVDLNTEINAMYFYDWFVTMSLIKAYKNKNDATDFPAESILFSIALELESDVTDEEVERLSKLINEELILRVKHLRSLLERYKSKTSLLAISGNDLYFYTERLLSSTRLFLLPHFYTYGRLLSSS